MKKFLVSIMIVMSFQLSANECGTLFSNFTSPICTQAKYIFWTGSSLALGFRLLKQFKGDDEIQRRANQKNHLKQFGEFGGDIGYGYFNIAYALGQFAFGGSKGAERGEHMLESSFYTLGVTYGLKKSIHETRPGYPDDPDSFPSGHSSAAFAFASVIAAQHGWIWGGGAHLIATFIAFSRLNDDWHYLHDVIAGMTIGLSYGWGIYFNHKEHNKPYWLSLAPSSDLQGLSLAFSATF